jgi:hypothetical protein
MLRRRFVVVVVVAFAGCGPSQECRDYVACQQAYDPNVDVKDYDERGVCWSLPSTARDCTAQCREALIALQQTPNAPSVCGSPP